MDNILVFKQANEHGFEHYYVSVEKSYLEKIKKCAGANFRGREISKLIKESEGTHVTVELHYFQEILESMLFQADLCSDIEFYSSIAGQFNEQYTTAFNNYIALRGKVDKANIVGDYSRTSLAGSIMNKVVFDEDLETLTKAIDCIESLIDSSCIIFKQRDLGNAKEIVLGSLKYIVSPAEIMKYRQEYDDMLSEVPIDLEKIETYLKSLQEIILDDWRKGITSIEDYKPGSKFRFIGHSTNSEDFKGDFYSSLVSCSLFTEEFTDTYRSGFGFLFAPEAIVGADGSDMYVNNYTEDDEAMLNTTTVPKISSIGRILDQCRRHREENKRNGSTDKVYSEVVIKGFKPIGIFCFTVGEKALNRNYQSAKKLQEQYPDLPIIEIDLTLYKAKEDLEWYRNRLIFEIEKNINSSTLTKNERYYDLYEYFWQNYLKLKQSGKYCEGDIISLYRENNELISMRIDPEKLFSGKYSVEGIRWALLHNQLYGLNKILNGKFTNYDLKQLGYELASFVDNDLLKQAFPGLSELVKIINEVEVTYINVEVICQRQPVTIESITTVLQLELDKRVEGIKDDITVLQGRKQALIESKTFKESQLEENQKHKRVIDYEYLYAIAHSDYGIVEEQLASINREKEEIEIEYAESTAQANNLSQQHTKLSKHKIFNFFKLRKLNVELMKLKMKMNALKSNVDSKSKEARELQENLDVMKEQFKNDTGIDLLEYPKQLEISKELYNVMVEISLPYDISEIQHQIDLIDQRLMSLQSQQQHLEEISVHKK